VHHKFVVCGFNTNDPVVYCGSSNLALGGEQLNGDNLLALHDPAVATVFAIEALGLIDHFHFLNRSTPAAEKEEQASTASKQQAAKSAGWFLSTSGRWAKRYFRPERPALCRSAAVRITRAPFDQGESPVGEQDEREQPKGAAAAKPTFSRVRMT
jgi:hypothetical protein